MTPGRPRASSRATIEDAAAELFLERSYVGTTVDDIALRAGVSRATFFNYFDSKSDLLWSDADRAIATLSERLGAGDSIFDAILHTANEVGSERVPLAVSQSDVMGTRDELVSSGLLRVTKLVELIRQAIVTQEGSGGRTLATTVRANACAGAVIAAWESWIFSGVDRRPLKDYIRDALALVQLEQ